MLFFLSFFSSTLSKWYLTGTPEGWDMYCYCCGFSYSLKWIYINKYTSISPISLILTVPSSWLLLASLLFYFKQWNIFFRTWVSNSIERKLRRVNRLLFFFVMQSASNPCTDIHTGKGVYHDSWYDAFACPCYQHHQSNRNHIHPYFFYSKEHFSSRHHFKGFSTSYISSTSNERFTLTKCLYKK